MKRGSFDFLANLAYTEDVSRSWVITFLESTCYWYDLVINPPKGSDIRKQISDKLNEKKKEVEESINKRFIYFLVSRPKVRFDTSRSVKRMWFSLGIIVPVITWPNKRRRRIKFTTAYVEDGKAYYPSVKLTETMITMTYKSGQIVEISIHDFLQMADNCIGANSQIRYVGSTKDPASRLLSRKHRGLTDTIYNVGSENYDFFLFVNVCHVRSTTVDPGYGLHIYTTNSLTDEVSIDDERHLVEGALIEYFQCESQKLNKKTEKASFEKRMRAIRSENKIERIAIWLGIEGECEYFNFYSSERSAKGDHIFSYEIDEELKITQYKTPKELYSSLGIEVEL